MKRTLIKKVSRKQAKRNRELAKIPVPEVCSDCGKTPDFRGLAKHHIILRSRGGKDNPANLEWLCGTCHNLRHGIREIYGNNRNQS